MIESDVRMQMAEIIECSSRLNQRANIIIITDLSGSLFVCVRVCDVCDPDIGCSFGYIAHASLKDNLWILCTKCGGNSIIMMMMRLCGTHTHVYLFNQIKYIQIQFIIV